MRETPSSELKLQYKRVLELALIFSLAFHILFMQTFKKVKVRAVQRTAKLKALEVEEIPQKLIMKSLKNG